MPRSSWQNILAGKGKRYLRKFHFGERMGGAIGMERRPRVSAAYLSHLRRHSSDHFVALRESHFGIRTAFCPGHFVFTGSELSRTNEYGLIDLDLRFHF